MPSASFDTALRQVRQLEADMGRLAPLARPLTDDEATLFAAAVEAGGVIVPRKLRALLAGESCWPVQFEGCYVPAEDADSAWVRKTVAKNTARRDAFFDRVESGDLRVVLERINGSASRVAA